MNSPLRSQAVFPILICLFMFTPWIAFGQCVGDGDVTGDGSVTLDDYEAFFTCMDGPGVLPHPAECNPTTLSRCDFDLDSDVDLDDASKFLKLFQAQYLPYGPHLENREAEMLAMTLANSRRAPLDIYQRIQSDLAAIRIAYPQLVTVIDDPDYATNQLLVGLQSGQPLDEYYALNDYYLVQSEEDHTFFRLLEFCDNINALVVAEDYAALDAIAYAEPNWLIGIDDFITVEAAGDIYTYDIDDGFWDCFDGCDCHRVYQFEVDGNALVTLIDYQEYGQSWCEF